MRHKLLPALIGVAFACVTHGPAFASNNKAMDADIHSVELQWEHIKFDEDGSPNQFAHIDALANFTATLVEKYPGRPEPLIWEGIVTSEEAGMANTLSAMGYAKKAKSILEEAYQENPAAPDESRRALLPRAGLSLRLRRQRQGASIAGAGRLARAKRHGRELFLCRFSDGPA
jgi:hypothetical protein